MSVEDVSGSSEVVMDVKFLPMLPDLKLSWCCDEGLFVSSYSRELKILLLYVFYI